MRTCCLIRQKKVNGKKSIYVEKDKQIALLSQYELINIEIIISKTSISINNKPTRKNITFIRIGTKSSSLYLKAISQYTTHVLPPLIKMRQLRHNFVNSIYRDILETIHWYEADSVSDSIDCNKPALNYSKSHDNPPILQSIYPILDSLKLILLILMISILILSS